MDNIVCHWGGVLQMVSDGESVYRPMKIAKRWLLGLMPRVG